MEARWPRRDAAESSSPPSPPRARLGAVPSLVELSAFLVAGLVLGTAIHVASSALGVPVVIRLVVALAASETLFVPPASEDGRAKLYFRLGVFYAQAPIGWLADETT